MLQNQAALVFGASSGVGRATALAFAREGAAVGLAARNKQALAEVAAAIEAGGGRAIVLPADVGDRAQVDAAAAQTIAHFGGIDVVVNSAGVNTRNRRLDVLTESEWNRLLSTNLTGAFNTTQAVLGHMRERGGGLIIQISSVSGRWGDGSGAAYQASKHGVIGLCQATMFEERRNGIRVSAILPGLIDTPMPMGRPVPPSRELLDRAIQPEDIARACVFLACLPSRTYVPEMIMLPGQLQCIGQTAI